MPSRLLPPAVGLAALALLTSTPERATAQIELGEEWLLDGDFSLDLGIDTLYASTANLGAGGGNQTWTFAGLTAHDTAALRTRPAREGALADTFPAADFILTAGIGLGIVPPDADAYLRRRDDDVFVVGVDDPLGSPVVPFVALDEPYALQSAPVLYEQVGDAETRATRVVSGATAAEATEIAELAGFDSIRVTFSQRVDYVVDAWGTVELGGRSFESLRIRSETVTEQRVEASVGSTPFTDITALVAATPFGEGLGTQRVVDYSWVAAEVSFPIVQVTLDADGVPEQLRFALEGTSSLADVRAGGRLAFAAFVGSGSIALEVAGAPLDTRGTVTVYDAAGVELARHRDVALDRGRLILPTDAWPAGVKLATVWAGGRPVATRRFFTE